MSRIGVIYARYSSDGQREESIEGQIRDCTAFAQREDIILLSPYIDRAFSAKTDDRPAFQQMIKDSAKRLFDVVIVWKLDRFSRNRYDSAHYKNILKKNGVQVISATEGISQDSTGILMESVLEGMAEFYSAELAQKVRRGHRENALKHYCNGGTLPMGFLIEDKHYQIDPKTAPYILRAFELYDKGHTQKDIITLLNSEGFRTHNGNKPDISFISRVLRNQKYAGDYVYGDFIDRDVIPAIVPRDLFNRVQERLDKNTKASARYKAPEYYLLTSKLFCGLCGSKLNGESGTSSTKRIHNYYKCASSKKRRGCLKKSVRKDAIENLVIEYTKKMIFDDAFIDCLADVILKLQASGNDRVPLYKEQLAETKRMIENILNALQRGIFTPSIKQRLDELEERKGQLEVSILEDELQNPKLTKGQVVFWLRKFRKFNIRDEKQCQQMIDRFVNAVYVYDDKLVITLNYKEGSQEIPFEYVKGPDIVAKSATNLEPFPIGEGVGFMLSLPE